MKQNLEAQQRYAARMQSIRTALERLSQASSENFGVNPDNAGWGDVTLASDIDGKLKELCDQLFREGEYAA